MRWWVLFAPRLAVDAWAVWVLWAWFVAPLGVVRIGYWQAMGLELFVGLFFMFGATSMESDEDTRFGLAAVKLFIAPLTVGIGWIIHQVAYG